MVFSLSPTAPSMGHEKQRSRSPAGALGFTLIIAGSLFGIGALLAASANALTVLKWVGGAYLVWLGIQVWRSPAVGALQGPQESGTRGSHPFSPGISRGRD